MFVISVIPSEAGAALTVTPSTWNIIGLDSNSPLTGPNRFPVGARVCSDSSVTDVAVAFAWESANAYIDLRAGSLSSITIPSISAGGCADAFFEVEVQRDALAFGTSRRYKISAESVSTPTPRALYVERLISQSRNYITSIKLDGVLIPAGGAMNLVVGNTYTIELKGGTATQGYNQFEEFINFPNTIFQMLSVSTTYSANTAPHISNPHAGLYADACGWENDPNSPFYRSCVGGDYKTGGSIVTTTYTVKIVGGGGTSENLSSLLYDFSGASYHYNADYSVGARIANIIQINPASMDFTKVFTPNPASLGGVTALTLNLKNNNGGAVSDVNFTDPFPTNMTVASTPNASTSGCGSPTFSPAGGANSISFSGGTIAANGTCTVRVEVTTSATGTFDNTSGNLYLGTTDTTKTASASLTVNSTPPLPAPPSSCAGQEVTLATWSFPNSLTHDSTGPNVFSPTATYSGTGTSSFNGSIFNSPSYSWSTNGYTSASTATSATDAALEFTVNTFMYNGIGISFATRITSGSWGGTNRIYAFSKADSGAYSEILSSPNLPTSWTTYPASGMYNATQTGSNSTTFRITAAGAKSGAQNPSSVLYVDDVVIKGCARPNPPTITKTFLTSPIGVNQTSKLRFTITNPNSGSSLAGVAFSDTFPSTSSGAPGNMVVASPNGASTSGCGSPIFSPTEGTGSVTFTGGTIAAGGTCTVDVDVTVNAAGIYNNISGNVSATASGTNSGSNGTASATLTAVSPPSISKRFAPSPIAEGGRSTLTFSITNPNQSYAMTSVAFSDTLPTSPANMLVATPPNAETEGCGSPTFAPSAGAGSVSFTGGSIAAGGTCTVKVDVTATAGTYNNTSGSVSHLVGGVTANGNTASASLTVSPGNPGISFLKQVGKGGAGDPWKSSLAVPVGGNVYYRLTIENTGDVSLNPVSVSDPDLSGEELCAWTAPLPAADRFDDDHITTCTVGPVTAVSGSHVNTATASGTYSIPYTAQSSATYATTALSIAKSATQTHFTAEGNVLNYSFVVTNSGYVALKGPATIDDDKSDDEACPSLSTVGDFDNYLDPGEAITCTATYTVLAADVTAKKVTNIATATADGVTSPNGTVTVPMSSFTVLKSVVAYSDPINGTTSPKAIPGSEMVYTVQVVNTGLIAASNVVITDPLPANTEFFAGDINGAGSGPVRFVDGSIVSGLAYSFISLSDGTDGISFSNDGGGTYTYTPVPDGSGFDANVTNIKITPTGTFNASDGTNNPSFELKFKVRVK